jgi:hypothetical protein
LHGAAHGDLQQQRRAGRRAPGKNLLDWLAKNEIPYDEIWFGKPHADVYLDDNGFRFTNWDEISAGGGNLPLSREKSRAAK